MSRTSNSKKVNADVALKKRFSRIYLFSLITLVLIGSIFIVISASTQAQDRHSQAQALELSPTP